MNWIILSEEKKYNFRETLTSHTFRAKTRKGGYVGLRNLARKEHQTGCLCRDALVPDYTGSDHTGVTGISVGAVSILRVAGENESPLSPRGGGWSMRSTMPTFAGGRGSNPPEWLL